MAYASFHQPGSENPGTINSNATELTTSKGMGKVYLYMGLGLVITALVALGVGAFFAGWLTNWTYDVVNIENASSNAVYTFFGVVIVSFIGLLIDAIVMGAVLARERHSIWPHYIIYSVLMGAALSVIIVAGASFTVIGEAFGISALAFIVMGLIGYFSKKDLNILAMVAYAALMMLMLIGLVFAILYFVMPMAYVIWAVSTSAVVSLLMLLVVAVDTYNIKKIIARSQASENVYLYCAYTMYSDFIVIFLRVLYVLMVLKGNDK